MIKKIFLMICAVSVSGVFSAHAVTPVAGKVNTLSQSEFVEQISDYNHGIQGWKYKGKRPAIIDFYATWCGPCKQISPIMDELAKKYEGKIDFYKIDVDKAPQLSQAFGVSSIPMILFIPMEKNPQAIMGAYPKAEIEKVIDYVIYGKK